MKSHVLNILETIYFTSKNVFYITLYAGVLNYLSTTVFDKVTIWFAASGIIIAVLWLILPLIRKDEVKPKQEQTKQRGKKG